MILEPTLHLFVALYTDEDVTADLAPALRLRGYIAQSTAEAGNAEISDEAQLIYAAEQGMAILTYNTRHFISLAHVCGTPPDESMLAVSSPNSSARGSSVNFSSVSCDY